MNAGDERLRAPIVVVGDHPGRMAIEHGLRKRRKNLRPTPAGRTELFDARSRELPDRYAGHPFTPRHGAIGSPVLSAMRCDSRAGLNAAFGTEGAEVVRVVDEADRHPVEPCFAHPQKGLRDIIVAADDRKRAQPADQSFLELLQRLQLSVP